MRKCKIIVRIVLPIVAVVASLISVILCATVSGRVNQLTRTNRADMIYLRGCVRNLESNLTDALAEGLAGIGQPVLGDEIDVPQAETETDTDAEVDPEEETDAVDLPAITVPEETPAEETSSSEEGKSDEMTDAEEESEPAEVLYTLAIVGERIGVLDTTGRVLCSLNVFTPTLPAADLDALTEGIPIYSQEELWEVLDKYA